MRYIILYDITIGGQNRTVAACRGNSGIDVIIPSDRSEAENYVREIKSLEPAVKNVRLYELTEVEL